jgi:hypothetical protein
LGLHSSFSDTKTVSDWLYIPWIYIYTYIHTYIYIYIHVNIYIS